MTKIVARRLDREGYLEDAEISLYIKEQRWESDVYTPVEFVSKEEYEKLDILERQDAERRAVGFVFYKKRVSN